MEKLLETHLRILDIDPYGDFIRLINLSHHQSLDLSNVNIRQCQVSPKQGDELVLNNYQFKDFLRTRVRSGEVVTIYANGSNQIRCSIEPYIFVAKNVTRWLTDRSSIRTDLCLNKALIHSYRSPHLSSSNDIPTLFLNRIYNFENIQHKYPPIANDYSRFIYPYCLSNENITNPYTWGLNDRNERQFSKKNCLQINEIIPNFDAFPRRLTTASQRTFSSRMSNRTNK